MAGTKVITPIAILSYPFLDKTQPAQKGKEPKYSATFIFPPGSDLRALEAAMLEAIEARWPGKTKDPKFMAGLHKPLRNSPDDVLAKGYPEGSTFTNCRSNIKPGCVFPWIDPETKQPQRVPDDKIREVFYPGSKVRASLTAYCFDNEGKKGPTFGLNNIQWIGNGERLDNRVKAEEEFTADMTAAPADLADLIGKTE